MDRLEPIDARIVEVGGSHAQRELFHDTLLAAALRAERHDRAGRCSSGGSPSGPNPGHYWRGAGGRSSQSHAHDRPDGPGRGGCLMAPRASRPGPAAGEARAGSPSGAAVRDVPIILALIRGLAEYERLAHQVEATIGASAVTVSAADRTSRR